MSGKSALTTPPWSIDSAEAALDAGYRTFWSDTPCRGCGARLRRVSPTDPLSHASRCLPCQRRRERREYEKRKERRGSAPAANRPEPIPSTPPPPPKQPAGQAPGDSGAARLTRVFERLREIDTPEADLWTAVIVQHAVDCKTKSGAQRRRAREAMAMADWDQTCELAGLDPNAVQQALEDGGFVTRQQIRDTIQRLEREGFRRRDHTEEEVA